MECCQIRAKSTEPPEKIRVGSERDSGEVDLQELGVAFPVCWRVKDRVDVAEDIFWPECRFEVALAVGNEFEAELFGEVCDEFGLEVRDAPVFSRWPFGAVEGFLAGRFSVGGGVKVEWKYLICFPACCRDNAVICRDI